MMTETRGNLVGTGDLVARSGATPRQIDYWIRNGVIPTVDGAKGSGYARRIEEKYVPIAITLRRLSDAFPQGKMTTEILRLVVERHETGFLALSEWIILEWELGK